MSSPERGRRKMVVFEIDTNGDHIIQLRANPRQRRVIGALVVLFVLHLLGYGAEKSLAIMKWIFTLVP